MSAQCFGMRQRWLLGKPRPWRSSGECNSLLCIPQLSLLEFDRNDSITALTAFTSIPPPPPRPSAYPPLQPPRTDRDFCPVWFAFSTQHRALSRCSVMVCGELIEFQRCFPEKANRLTFFFFAVHLLFLMTVFSSSKF